MFLISKTLYLLFLPFTWIGMSLLWGVLTRSELRRKQAIRLTLVLFIIFTNPILQNRAFMIWEAKPILFDDIPEGKYDVGVVLTGFSHTLVPTDRVHFLKGTGRLIHTVRLYKEKKIKKILVSGISEVNIMGDLIYSGPSLKNVFLNCGVREEDLIIEPQSRNTHENAVNSARILTKKFPNRQILLITSAFHMRRSKACFEKQNIDFHAFATDYYATKPFAKWLPSSRVLLQWNILFKEWMGIVAYRLLGYI